MDRIIGRLAQRGLKHQLLNVSIDNLITSGRQISMKMQNSRNPHCQPQQNTNVVSNAFSESSQPTCREQDGQKDIAGGGSILYAELQAMLHGNIDRDSDPSINRDIGDICFI